MDENSEREKKRIAAINALEALEHMQILLYRKSQLYDEMAVGLSVIAQGHAAEEIASLCYIHNKITDEQTRFLANHLILNTFKPEEEKARFRRFRRAADGLLSNTRSWSWTRGDFRDHAVEMHRIVYSHVTLKNGEVIPLNPPVWSKKMRQQLRLMQTPEEIEKLCQEAINASRESASETPADQCEDAESSPGAIGAVGSAGGLGAG